MRLLSKPAFRIGKAKESMVMCLLNPVNKSLFRALVHFFIERLLLGQPVGISYSRHGRVPDVEDDVPDILGQCIIKIGVVILVGN